MEINKDTKICIVGLGLMGGSYAGGFSKKGILPYAINRSKEPIDYALERGWIKEGRTEITPDYLGQFDVIIICLYPHIVMEWIKENQKYLKSGAIITDVTGVKNHFVTNIQAILREDLEFIGSHPMAGREASGIDHSSSEVFEGANYIITPTEKNTDKAISLTKSIATTLGFSNISVLSPEEHDEMIGFLSQLTHCIAVALMTCRDTGALAKFSGDSFRDLTRIAKINEKMWSELFLFNKVELLKQMELFETSFIKLKDYIKNDDAASMMEMMIDSTKSREAFDNVSKGGNSK